MKERITLVKSNKANFLPINLGIKNVSVKLMFREIGRVQELVRALLLHQNIPLPDFFYNNELINLDTDLIIVTDCHLQTKFVNWLHDNNPGTRMIVWYWNTIEEIGANVPPEKIPEGVEKWSYSPYDCEIYGLKYNTTCYPHVDEIDMSQYEVDTDVYFLGKDKGRLAKILEVKNMLESQGLSTLFHICPTKRYQLKNNKIYKPQIPYKEVLERIAKSRAIVDCCVTQNAGPTIRPMEALFYKRKLITDDKKIAECDYYEPENIFILGVDDENTLKEFVRKPYKKLANGVAEKYTMEQWFSRLVVPSEKLPSWQQKN